MGNRIIHCHVSVRGLLKTASRAELASMFSHTETGEPLTADEAKDVLLEQLARGREVLPFGMECEGFDYSGGGCPGHEQEEDPHA